MSFYLKYLRLCNEKGVSPSKAAIEAGSTKTSVTRWKEGSLPTDANIAKLADYFDVDVSYFTEEDTPVAPAEMSDNLDLRLIARAGSKMSAEQAAQLRRVAEVMFPEAFK